LAPTTNYRQSRQSKRSGDATVRLADGSPRPSSADQHDEREFQRSAQSTTNEGHQTTCPDCSAENTVTEEGTRYCADCGLVLADRRLTRSEPSWRDTADRRLGPQQSQQWVNTGTTIARGPDDNSDRFVKYNQRLRGDERSLVDGLRELRQLGATLELPGSTRERAAYWYRKAHEAQLLKGRSIGAFAAACVFAAARESHQPVTIDCIAKASPVEATKIRHHVQLLQCKLSVTLPPASPGEFLPAVVSTLSLDMAIERRAARYLERVTDEQLHVGKHPAAIAATAVYAAATEMDVDLTQETVASAADVSAVTISRRYQEVKEVVRSEEP